MQQIAERGAGDEALQHLLTRERGRLDDDEQGRQPAEALGRPTWPASERTNDDRDDPGDRQHQRRLIERGQIGMAGSLKGERALVRIGDRDQVGERVPEHQAGRGRAERRETSEPRSFTHVRTPFSVGGLGRLYACLSDKAGRCAQRTFGRWGSSGAA